MICVSGLSAFESTEGLALHYGLIFYPQGGGLLHFDGESANWFRSAAVFSLLDFQGSNMTQDLLHGRPSLCISINHPEHQVLQVFLATARKWLSPTPVDLHEYLAQTVDV